MKNKREKQFKIIYPNDMEKEQYIQELVESYNRIYAEFTDTQIRVPVKIIVNNLYNDSKEFAKFSSKVISLYELKTLANGIEPEENNEIFLMLQGHKIAIRKFIGIRNKVPMPEDQELMTSYAEFIREMTKNTLNAICDATYNNLPSTYKLQYPKWFEEMYGNEEVDATDSSHDNLSESKVVFTLPKDKTEENAKKKSVTWKEQIYEQKIYEREVQDSDTQESDDKNDLSNKENCVNNTVSSPNNNNISQKSSSSSSVNEDLEKSNEKDNTAKTASVTQNDNLSVETSCKSDIYHSVPANDILSQLQEKKPNIVSLELNSKLDILEVQNEEKQETEKLMAEIELTLENQQVKVSMLEYLNSVNETIWDNDGLAYINHHHVIYKPESIEKLVSLPSNSIIISDLIPKIDSIAFLGTFAFGQKHDAGGDMLNLGFMEGIFL